MAARLRSAVLMLLAGSALAWSQTVPTVETSLKVHVAYSDDRPADSQLRVELLTSSGSYVSMAVTDDRGEVEFPAVRSGNYRLRVTGADIEDTTTRVFFIYPRQSSHAEYVNVVSKGTGQGVQASATSAPVSQTSLNIPPQGQKEYDKGGKAMQKNNWAEARMRLEKAIALYPQFAAAYNELGVVHMNTGNRQQARAAFEKAVEIDPNYGRANRNLAMLSFSEGRNQEAAALLEKSLASDPLDPQVLTLLAQLQLLAGKTEEALFSARKVHSVPHEGQAVAHFIAARALETRNRNDEAAAEYRMFLQEAPNSASAPKARAALEKLTAKVN